MIKLRLEIEKLSVRELENISKALRTRCVECIEKGVAEPCRHPEEVTRFLDAMADAVDRERRERVRRERMMALGVDPETGEWEAGA